LSKAWSEGLIFGVLVYVVMQPVLRAMNGKSLALYTGYESLWKKIMLGYNVFLCLYSFATFIACLNMFLTVTGFDAWFIYEPINNTIPGCVHGLYRPGTGFETIAYYFYLSKYVEYADTLFLIVMNKQVIPLHYFHHLYAAADMWILHRSQNDSIWIFVFFNSAIHTLMYFYYAAVSLKYHVGPIKVVLTMLQILQLFGGTLLSCLPYFLMDCYKNDPFMNVSFWFSFLYTSTLVVFFSQFFVTSYCSRRDARKKDL